MLARTGLRKTRRPDRRGFAVLSILCIFCCLLFIDRASAGKAADQKVDSGSFAVIMNGKRVATETFSISQDAHGSVVASDFHADDGTAAQSSQLELTTNGDLYKYEWKELSPGKGHATVAPDDKFLVERFSMNPQDKMQEQPFLLPSSTSMLDDYVFIHREVLAWKDLAMGCRQEKGVIECPLNQHTQFGTLNPHQRASMPVSLEYAGREKITVHGTERELIRLNLKGETGDWALWLDDQFKLIRMSVPAENTEILRD